MGEPKATAERAEEVVPGVRNWWIHDERINARGDAYAVETRDGTVLIDPLPLEAELGPVAAVVLTSGSHQRSAWRLRRELGVPVWIPEQVQANEEEPDARYGEGDDLPGGLDAYFTPGAGTTQHTLLHHGIAFTSDLLVVGDDGRLRLISDRWAHDPAQVRESARRLLQLDFELVCTGHGGPVADDPKAAILACLQS